MHVLTVVRPRGQPISWILKGLVLVMLLVVESVTFRYFGEPNCGARYFLVYSLVGERNGCGRARLPIRVVDLFVAD